MPEKDTRNVVERMAAVMAEVTHVEKGDQFNGGQTRYAYRGVDRVVSALSAAMRKHGLVMTPFKVNKPEWLPISTSSGKPASMVRLVVHYAISAPDMSQVFVVAPGEAMDSSDKAVSKAMSVAWRTALLQSFFLPTDEPDPDAEHTEIGGPQARVTPAVTQKLQKFDDEQTRLEYASWYDAIEERKDDLNALLALYNEARKAGVPKTVLTAISTEGEKLK